MRITYDAEADAAYVFLVDPIPPDGAVRQQVAELDLDGSTLIVDRDTDGRLLGLEILGARDLLDPRTLAGADRLDQD